MDEKRVKILESAAQLFSKNGYEATSVQDVAEVCGMSKATLYKYFSSKQTLLIEVIEYNHQRMSQRTEEVKDDESLGPLEALEQKVVVLLEEFKENHYFIQLLFRSMPEKEDKQVRQLMDRGYRRMFLWHKQSLRDAFRISDETRMNDLVLLFQGMMKEYLFILSEKNDELFLPSIASYIRQVLQMVIENKGELTHVLPEDWVAEVNIEDDVTPLSREERMERLLHEMKMRLQAIGLSKHHDTFQVLEAVEEECGRSPVRQAVVTALLPVLKKEQSIATKADALERLLIKNP
ncbi:TetR/AcrR family transcriptional regulator [Halobacillus halophilus]|uniref:TetR/AcrR family transcriptional regulator n=1 Tax=Halobacillus halophilus TaxID=1570 RepID=UPI001CD29808|nr:TetR/AcrR family transcriptional regulator [Halobacillus halophilus]MCA1011556.1 TetR/AcrR family transcriptional regulator [Halobacillus halophilus]